MKRHLRPGSCDLWLDRSPGAKPARVFSARWCMTRSTLFSRLGTLVLAGATITCSSNEPNPPAEAAVLAMTGGNSQSAPAGQALANPIGVRVTDDNGDPVADVTVAWSAGDGGSVSASSVSTDDDGRASVTWTLGPAAGSQTATAAVDGLDGSPVQFTATAVETGEITLTVTQQPPGSVLDDGDLRSGESACRAAARQRRRANGRPGRDRKRGERGRDAAGRGHRHDRRQRHRRVRRPGHRRRRRPGARVLRGRRQRQLECGEPAAAPSRGDHRQVGCAGAVGDHRAASHGLAADGKDSRVGQGGARRLHGPAAAVGSDLRQSGRHGRRGCCRHHAVLRRAMR